MPNGAGPVMPETPTQASPTESEDAVYTYRGRTYRMPKSESDGEQASAQEHRRYRGVNY
ncbi:MAG: DUF4278 domain-containing protein [Cyanothece sp. SIO1E1]|nr:DUF4278 domain-containing protein [Cyanothece sp. SIO1E1]